MALQAEHMAAVELAGEVSSVAATAAADWVAAAWAAVGLAAVAVVAAESAQQEMAAVAQEARLVVAAGGRVHRVVLPVARMAAGVKVVGRRVATATVEVGSEVAPLARAGWATAIAVEAASAG